MQCLAALTILAIFSTRQGFLGLLMIDRIKDIGQSCQTQDTCDQYCHQSFSSLRQKSGSSAASSSSTCLRYSASSFSSTSIVSSVPAPLTAGAVAAALRQSSITIKTTTVPPSSKTMGTSQASSEKPCQGGDQTIDGP